VAAYLLAGADVVMTASSLLRHGPAHTAVLLDGLRAWMERKGFCSADEFRGMLAQAADAAQPGYGRSDYLSAVERAAQAYAPR
jgi:dihydroorotate dehydrogenase (fumarate)